jgi:hypothetical protein
MKTAIEMILLCLVGAEGKGRTRGRLALRFFRSQPTAATVNYLMVFARKSFEQGRHIIAKLAVADPALLQNVPGQDVKIKLSGNPQMPAVIQDCINQPRMIENGIARFDIAQKIDKRKLIGLRTR